MCVQVPVRAETEGSCLHDTNDGSAAGCSPDDPATASGSPRPRAVLVTHERTNHRARGKKSDLETVVAVRALNREVLCGGEWGRCEKNQNAEEDART